MIFQVFGRQNVILNKKDAGTAENPACQQTTFFTTTTHFIMTSRLMSNTTRKYIYNIPLAYHGLHVSEWA